MIFCHGITMNTIVSNLYIVYTSELEIIYRIGHIYTLGHKLGTTKFEMQNIFYIALFFLLEYICLIHKHIFFLGTCNFLSIDQLKNDETSSPVPLQNSSLAGVSNRYLHVQCRWNFKLSKLYFNMGNGKGWYILQDRLLNDSM